MRGARYLHKPPKKEMSRDHALIPGTAKKVPNKMLKTETASRRTPQPLLLPRQLHDGRPLGIRYRLHRQPADPYKGHLRQPLILLDLVQTNGML